MKILGTMDIYKNNGESHSNYGLSSKFEYVRIIKADKSEMAEIQDNDVIIDVSEVCGKPYTRAYDAKLFLSGRRPMFGGCFVYTCNGIVPHSGEAIKLFDRIEH
jgi:hypothetical protein